MSYLLEIFRSGTTVVFLTGGCFCLNCAGLIFYSGGLIREKSVMGKRFGYGWIFDVLFSLECVLNGFSDLALLAAVSYRSRDERDGFPIECLTCTLKGFIVWNTFSVVGCWTASCALYHERDIEFGGIYPYALFNDSALNATTGALVDSSFTPTLPMLYISATLIAAVKLLLLYGVYFGYLQAVVRDSVLADPFVAYANECDRTQSFQQLPAPSGMSNENCSPHLDAASLPKEWGQPSQSSFRPPTEWSSSDDRRNPFAENEDERLTGVQVVSSSLPIYPVDRWTGSVADQSPPEVPHADLAMEQTGRGNYESPPAVLTMSVPHSVPEAPAGTWEAHVPTTPALPSVQPSPITGPLAHQPLVEPPQQPPPLPTAVPAGPPMSSPSPRISTPASVPLYTGRPSLVPPAPLQPEYLASNAAAPAPSLTNIVPDQSFSTVQGYAPPLGSNSQRRVSISEQPSVTTFSTTDAASGTGGPAQASTGTGQSSPSPSIESVASTLSKILDNLTALPPR